MIRVTVLSAIAFIALAPTAAYCYVLGPGDQVSIEVRAAQTQLSLAAQVSVDGRVYVAPAGDFVAEGKTPAELEADLARELGKYLAGPVQVAVLVTTPKEIRVLVLGQVAQPGAQRLPDAPPPLLSDAIAKAGGLLPQASARRVSVFREGRELGPIDLYAVLTLGRSEHDIALRRDDVIYVPARQRWVTVIGAAERPGVYELLEQDRLSDIIRIAGGLSHSADPVRAVIERVNPEGAASILEANLHAALAHPGSDADPLLAHGDTVRIAARAASVYVVGEVFEPGAKRFDSNLTVLDYIGLAGGITRRAKARSAAIIRPASPQPRIIRLDLARLMAGRGTAAEPIQPGDIIYVPERPISTVQDWTAIGNVLVGLVAGIRLF